MTQFLVSKEVFSKNLLLLSKELRARLQARKRLYLAHNLLLRLTSPTLAFPLHAQIYIDQSDAHFEFPDEELWKNCIESAHDFTLEISHPSFGECHILGVPWYGEDAVEKLEFQAVVKSA